MGAGAAYIVNGSDVKSPRISVHRTSRPRRSRAAGSGRLMNANLRNFALWVIIVLLLLALFTLFQNPGQRTTAQDISFSQLLTEVDQGRVRDVVIQGPEIHGTFANGTSFQTYAPNDPGLVQKLYAKGVAITARPPSGQRAVVRLAAGLVAAVHRADRRVDFPVAPDAGRAAARRSASASRAPSFWPRRMAASPSKTSPASTRPSRICRRSSNSCATPENSSASADAFRAACCWSARPAPARR